MDIQTISRDLTLLGWTLRSGLAEGADRAFESRAVRPELYSPHNYPLRRLAAACKVFESSVRRLAGCPSIYDMEPLTRSLLARSMHQVLGADLASPASCVVCWTPHTRYQERSAGGTRYAVLLAQSLGIPIFNLCEIDLSLSGSIADLVKKIDLTKYRE